MKKIYDDGMLTAPMILGQIYRMHRCVMRAGDADGIMSQNSCRAILIRLSFGDGITQLELAGETRLKPPTVSVALKRMETEGYVRRVTDPEDMRAVRVFLTDKGKALDENNVRRLTDLDARMMEGFSDEEKRTLCDMLLRMRNNLSLMSGEEH